MTEKLIRRAAQMIAFGLSVAEVRSMLRGEGVSEENSFLIYQAATIFARHW